MKTQLKLSNYVKPTPMPEAFCGDISGFDEQTGLWEIDHCFFAQVAVSLFVKPEEGDKVSFILLDAKTYIIQQYWFVIFIVLPLHFKLIRMFVG